MAAVVTTGLPPASGRSGLRGVVRSEFTKLRSVRSTYWTLLALLAVSVGLGAVISWATEAHWKNMSPGDQATFDPTQTSLAGMFFLGQLVIVVLGALVLTSEYSTGMIRTSLTAMPRRSVVYEAKALVFAGVALVVTLVASFVTFFLGQALLSSTQHQASLSGPGVLRAVIGSAVYVTLCGLFAYAVGSILRHTAGAITAVIGLLFVLPIIVNVLPHSWHDAVLRWLPSSAGNAISATVGHPDHVFSGWGEIIVFAAYVAALLLVGGWLFRTRDA
jgi:ABC-type transport system involved in multi-copper enzyme maturation permease subunit